MATRKRCDCGRAMASRSSLCKYCAKAKSDENYSKAEAVVTTGKCPDCRNPLKRNLALTGWWQCVAFGEPTMRPSQYRELPKCGFQTFTRH